MLVKVSMCLFFHLKLFDAVMKKLFRIKGMKCAACQAHVTKAVSSVAGISDVDVNLLTGILTAECDGSTEKVREVISAVTNIGFKAEAVEEQAVPSLPPDDSKSLFLRFLLSLLLFAVMMFCKHFLPHAGIWSIFGISTCQLVLMLLIVYLNRVFFIDGFRHLFLFSPDMNSLVALGSGSSIVYSMVQYANMLLASLNHDSENVNMLDKNMYYDTAVMILILVTLGRFFESRARKRTTEAIAKLIDLSPKTAVIRRKGEEARIPVSALTMDDIVVIHAGNTVPADGIVTEGTGSVDESAITGESVPVGKSKGDHVVSGSMNQSGSFCFRVEKPWRECTLNQIIRLVENAANSNAKISRLTDVVSRFFVPSVLLIAIASGTTWYFHGKPVSFCLSMAIGVLMVSCPCALGLATPVAVMVASGVGSKLGILFKNALALETMHHVRTLIFDKTGTLTNGKHVIVNTLPNPIHASDLKHVIACSAALEKHSDHPFSRAVLNHAKQQGIQYDSFPVSGFEETPGFGVAGTVDSLPLVCGNRRMMEKHGIDTGVCCDEIAKTGFVGCSPLFVANDGTKEIMTVFLLADMVRNDAKEAFHKFKTMGFHFVLLTGDTREAAEMTAKELEITDIFDGITPEGKERVVREIRAKNGGKPVAMIGDGINDAAALAAADVGIAIGSGTDIALETADIVLMNNRLSDVALAFRLSQAAIRTIKGNLFWAFLYNVICIPVAAGVLYPSCGFSMHPALCSLTMALSSLFVVGNALRLKRFRC